ncbi:zf-TFIIB domain-containing protein [Corallincola platygyrae]|uniref:Zf-TFIIB domain-containing protein n=1 Tax=Corallincola platygyrae TaxID=1193278 RepID=A0ABW4XK10_9GAMM
MNCTCCNEGRLQPQLLDGLFKADVCDYCGGVWVLTEHFVGWKAENPDQLLMSDLMIEEIEATDTQHAIACPISGRLMRKLKISTDVPHRIDYSAAVGGIWLDKGEWELIKASGLADILNTLVTQHWQDKVKSDKTKQNFEKHYIEKFGAENYRRLREIRDWLAEQENAAELKDYLLASDPYTTKR